MVNDTVSDLLARIKNGYMARRGSVVAPYATLSESVAKLLVAEGYLSSIKVKTSLFKSGREKKELTLTLKYDGKVPAVETIVRVSKPGARIYTISANLKPVLNGYGIAIISTSKGLMTNKQAHRQKLGGEILCKVW